MAVKKKKERVCFVSLRGKKKTGVLEKARLVHQTVQWGVKRRILEGGYECF